MIKKYQKVTINDYKHWYMENQDYRARVRKDPDRLAYHLMPETGWLNDPNGLCQKDGVYHIYYQYTPFEPTGEIKLWGHFTTRDFIQYEDRGPALFPDGEYDAHGAYSGSAFIEDNTIHYFYTGNIKYFGDPGYDYITSGRGSNTLHFTSRDGEHFTGKELVFTNHDYPEDMTCHVRDPKVFKKEGSYYMVLGARTREDRGVALIYRSEDLKNWHYYNRIATQHKFGYMWECPDLFELDQKMYLLCCPQGVEKQGINYENVYQCTFIPLTFDFEKNQYCICDSKIRMADRGFDFYAPQTFEDERGRRILIGWMGIPDAGYGNPTVEKGWQHALTLPRELSVRSGKLIQNPIEELKALRRDKKRYKDLTSFNQAEKTGQAGMIYEMEIQFDNCYNLELQLRAGTKLMYQGNLLTLRIAEGGFGRTDRSVELERLFNLRIFSDTTSLEIFVNDGEEVFTTRDYGKRAGLSIYGECGGEITVYSLGEFSIVSSNLTEVLAGETVPGQ